MTTPDEGNFRLWILLLNDAVENSQDQELKEDWKEYLSTLPQEDT